MIWSGRKFRRLSPRVGKLASWENRDEFERIRRAWRMDTGYRLNGRYMLRLEDAIFGEFEDFCWNFFDKLCFSVVDFIGALSVL